MDQVRVSVKESNRFVYDCLVAAGVDPKNAVAHAEMLCDADYRGLCAYGMTLLEQNCLDLQSGKLNGKAVPVIVKESQACYVVDGKDALGGVVGNFCMDLAIEKASKMGIGFVVAKNSTSFGAGSYYTTKAAQSEVIGFTCSSEPPRVTPCESTKVAIGHNPIAFSAPVCTKQSITFDMTTSNKDSCQVDEGQPNSFAEIPLGSCEFVGYKGFGLAMMVEILAGVLNGQSVTDENCFAGQCFIAISPKFFGTNFDHGIRWISQYLRELELANCEKKPVVIPGDQERKFIADRIKFGGIPYSIKQIEVCDKLAELFGVKKIQPRLN